MAENNAAFVGSVPENYDRHLGAMLFHGFADDLVSRLTVTNGMRVLETACGTGIVTERLARRLDGHGTLVATDLNAPMLAYARAKRFAATPIEWRQADATALPFDDASFDAVVCQFGLMFFPDKARAVREASRVLRRGGQYLVSVWDSWAHNAVQKIVHDTVAEFFPADPPQFYTVPFNLADPSPTREWLSAAGFDDVEPISVRAHGRSPTASEAAAGLIDGNPIAAAIVQRRADALPEVREAVARALGAWYGERELRFDLRAIVFAARKA